MVGPIGRTREFLIFSKILGMSRFNVLILLSFFTMLDTFVWGQTSTSYTSYITGDPLDVEAETTPGVVLMGGGVEIDEAMQWFLQRAGAGDVVVIRASGSNGYNNYLYAELGVPVNSVETIVFHSADAASDSYVVQRIREAEALWIAGGDQWNYVNYWRGNEVQDAIEYLIEEKGVTVGGTSAGMAILGEAYFSAQNGTITSATAMTNPFAANMTIGFSDFLRVPFLESTITDTHFNNPDRRGRLMAFLARLTTDHDIVPRAIACNEHTAVCVDENGMARVFGEYPQYSDYAWFVRPNCAEPWFPEQCASGQPLTWNRSGQAVKAIRIPGNTSGSEMFNLNTWSPVGQGEWVDWWVENGAFNATINASAPDCEEVGVLENADKRGLLIFTNPCSSAEVHFEKITSGKLFDLSGRLVLEIQNATIAEVNEILPGIYFWQINGQRIRWVRL